MLCAASHPHPHSWLRRGFRWLSHRKSVTLSLGTPLFSLPITYGRAYGLSFRWTVLKNLRTPLCGTYSPHWRLSSQDTPRSPPTLPHWFACSTRRDVDRGHNEMMAKLDGACANLSTFCDVCIVCKANFYGLRSCARGSYRSTLHLFYRGSHSRLPSQISKDHIGFSLLQATKKKRKTCQQ